MSVGPATVEMALQLHHLLVSQLQRKLKDDPSADYLRVARLVCKDHAVLGAIAREGDQKAMKKLHRLYHRLVDKFLEALEVEHPSAAVLAETLRFLEGEGITKREPAQAAQALKELSLASLPFSSTTPH